MMDHPNALSVRLFTSDAICDIIHILKNAQSDTWKEGVVAASH